MARDLNGSTQYLSTTQYVRVNGTILITFQPDWSSGDSSARFLFNCDDGVNGFLGIERFSDNNWYVGWLAGGGSIDERIVVSDSTMSVTAGTFYRLVYRWDDTTNLSAVFLDGISKGARSSLTTFDATGATSLFGVYADLTSSLHDGRFGTCALWSESLSDAEILALGQGVEPICIRPAVLLSEWLMIGSDSPEPDKLGVANMTLVNSPATAAHHSIAMRRSVPSRPSVAATVSSGIIKSVGRQFRLAGNGGGLVA